MTRNRMIVYALLGALLVTLGGALMAQTSPERTLLVNGRDSGTVVRQIEGRSYVELDVLVQLTKGTVAVEPTRVVLTIPVGASAPAGASQASSAQGGAPSGLSRDFARAAISELAEMREWRGAVGTMVTYGLAVSGGWEQAYRERVQDGLMQATVAASSDSDQQALQLLTNEFNRLAGWAGDVIAARQSLNAAKTVDPNSLQSDPVLAKITDCGVFLNSMLVSGSFGDNASCH